jgi:hypothetical protein
MKYFDGQEVYTGDKVIADKSEGVVVYVIDTHQGSEKHPVGSWDYLENGMRRSSFSAQKTVSPPLIFNSQLLFKFERAFVA